jgi:hypothetical protein
MLDEDLCRGMEIVECSALSITALLSLRDLIDAHSRPTEPSGAIASEASSPGGASDESTRQGVLLWEIPHAQELPQATQQRCRKLLTHMLLAAVNSTTINTEEEPDEREDSTESH